jgi:hypothetical protein
MYSDTKAPITGREGGRTMLSVVFIITVVLVALALIVRRGWWQRRTDQLPPAGIPRETLALEAFMQGNADLAGEKFAEATAAFQKARELDPKCLHVADRLAEVERRQQAMSAIHPQAVVAAVSENRPLAVHTG